MCSLRLLLPLEEILVLTGTIVLIWGLYRYGARNPTNWVVFVATLMNGVELAGLVSPPGGSTAHAAWLFALGMTSIIAFACVLGRSALDRGH